MTDSLTYRDYLNQECVLINRQDLDYLLKDMRRAAAYCEKARSPNYPYTNEDLNDEPTAYYSGASGFAGATLRLAIQILESNLRVYDG